MEKMNNAVFSKTFITQFTMVTCYSYLEKKRVGPHPRVREDANENVKQQWSSGMLLYFGFLYPRIILQTQDHCLN